MPQIAVICGQGKSLAEIYDEAKAISPTLFPASLPAAAFIKPNLCDLVSWEHGVTTDPQWIPVLARELRRIRPDIRIAVVESDAIGAYKTFCSCDETFDRLGYTRVAQECGVELLNLSRSLTVEIALPQIPFAVRIPEMFFEEFFFISVGNLKVHPYEHMTGILKNSLGLLPEANISHYHPYLAGLISALHRLCPPDLCIIDGRVGLEGKGPIQGDPVPMGTIIFGDDALATDVTACRLMTILPEKVPHLRGTACDLQRGFDGFAVMGEMEPRNFAFDPQRVHPQILAKFANRRLHRKSEILSNRWIDRFFRFKQEPFAFLITAVPRLLRRLYARS